MFVLCMVCVFVCMFVYGLGPWGEPIMGPWGGQSLIKPTNDHDSTPLDNYRVRKLSMEIFSCIASDYGAICFSSFLVLLFFLLRRGLAHLSESILLTVYQPIQEHFGTKFSPRAVQLGPIFGPISTILFSKATSYATMGWWGIAQRIEYLHIYIYIYIHTQCASYASLAICKIRDTPSYDTPTSHRLLPN
jgi:hypothetical protein